MKVIKSPFSGFEETRMTVMGGKVLIIDDEAGLRETLGRILQRAGCETQAAANGQQAMQLIGEQKFDLTYLDLHLPGMDGIQILKEIRQHQPKLPVIMLTGFGTLQSAVEALRLGATDYLLKPFDPEVLVARTRVILEEQWVERRKEELRMQIAALETELHDLEHDTLQPAPVSVSVPEPQNRFYKKGRLVVDLQARRATFGERVLNLPPATFDYLVVLARRSPEVVNYQTLVTDAQNYQVDSVEARELAKWHMHVLRQALEEDTQKPRFLLNVRGSGYRLLVD
jgi:DNA-binding response OmpR family regulator